MTRLCFCVNPAAGAGRTLPRLRRILARAPGLASRSRILPIASITELASRLADLADDEIPVAVGGDGTVQRVATALRLIARREMPLAVLPFGTGNAFAHAFGLGSLSCAVSALASNQRRRVDVFLTSHPQAPVVISSLSVGFESRVIAGFGGRDGWRRYLPGLARGLENLGGRWSGTAVSLDGETFLDDRDRVFNMGLYNQPYYAFGRRVHPQADPCDGRGLAVLHHVARTYWPVIARGPRAGGDAGCSREWQHAEIVTAQPIQADGEPLDGGRLTVRVDPQALLLVVPPSPTVPAPRPRGARDPR